MPDFDSQHCIATAITIAETLIADDEATYTRPVVIQRAALAVLTMTALKLLAVIGVEGHERHAVALALDALAAPCPSNKVH
jgi:hypothetical protein